MSELTLLLLQIAFLMLLWFFVFVIVYSLRSDLFGQRAKRLPDRAAGTFPTSPAPAPAAAVADPAPSREAHRAPPLQSDATPRRLVITSGPREGMEIDLPSEQLTIGRSSESGLVIRDDYTSTHHARLMLWNDEWVVQDLSSTNGTLVGGEKIDRPTPVPERTPVTIGTTTFELRR
ncbi:MAG: FHA domain-containing protein [Actinomycetales bacterium]|nr:FHA domain-containing protein [Actinomycetales bacterium]